jgi:hypothetical protein
VPSRARVAFQRADAILGGKQIGTQRLGAAAGDGDLLIQGAHHVAEFLGLGAQGRDAVPRRDILAVQRRALAADALEVGGQLVRPVFLGNQARMDFALAHAGIVGRIGHRAVELVDALFGGLELRVAVGARLLRTPRQRLDLAAGALERGFQVLYALLFLAELRDQVALTGAGALRAPATRLSSAMRASRSTTTLRTPNIASNTCRRLEDCSCSR